MRVSPVEAVWASALLGILSASAASQPTGRTAVMLGVVESALAARDTLKSTAPRVDACSVKRVLTDDALEVGPGLGRRLSPGEGAGCLRAADRQRLLQLDGVRLVSGGAEGSDTATLSMTYWSTPKIRASESYVLVRAPESRHWRLHTMDVRCCDSVLLPEMGRDGLAVQGVIVDFEPAAADVLIVVDGVVVTTFGEHSVPRALAGRIIESARMVHGAEAERRFGSRAAAGVLELTTRRP